MSSAGQPDRKPFTIAVIPDTQNYADHTHQSAAGFPINAGEMLLDMMQHIARNARNSGGDIVFATGMGDSWEHPSSWEPDPAHAAAGDTAVANPLVMGMIPASPREVREIEIPLVKSAYEIIADQLPFCLVPGNHDYDHLWTDPAYPPNPEGWAQHRRYQDLGSLHVGGLDHWTAAFGAHTPFFAGKPWYVAAFRGGASSAQLFEAGGYRFLHLGLEMTPDDAVLAWAQTVLQRFAGLPTLISIHEFINEQGEREPVACVDLTRLDPQRNGPQAVWEKFISKHDQIFMVLNGHCHGAAHRIDRNDHGGEVYQLLADYQGRKQSIKDSAAHVSVNDGVGDGWMRLMSFDLSAEPARLRVRTYSTYFKAFASSLPDYATWYASEHPELSNEAFLALDEFELCLDGFHDRFRSAAL